MPEQVIIIGAGGHGKVVADIVERSGDVVAGFLDDRNPAELHNSAIIGKVEDATKYSKGSRFIAAVGDNTLRQQLMTSLPCEWHTAIHPSAVIAPDVVIGKGSVVMANAVLNPGCTVGEGVIINSAATADHDCSIANYAHLSPGVHLAGEVSIAERTWVGIGASVIQCVSICADCVVGAGAVVVRDIVEPGTYIGVPAQLSTKASDSLAVV